MTWAALRDASSAVQLAVQMLAGPLAPWSDPPPDPERVRDAVTMLETSARRMNALVAALAPTAVAAPHIALRDIVEVAIAPALAPAIAAKPGRTTAARPRKRPVPAPSPIPTVTGVLAANVLRDVELALLGRPAAPRVAIHGGDGLLATGESSAIVAVLVGLVEDAAALGPADAVVELRAFADLADAIGDEMDVVFEVRPDARGVARGGPATAFAPNPSGLPDGARLEVQGRGSRPRACLRVAAATGALILAA